MIKPRHIEDVCSAIVKGIFVNVVTNHIIGGLCDLTVHADKLLFAFDSYGSANVRSESGEFQKPVISTELLELVRVNKDIMPCAQYHDFGWSIRVVFGCQYDHLFFFVRIWLWRRGGVFLRTGPAQAMFLWSSGTYYTECLVGFLFLSHFKIPSACSF